MARSGLVIEMTKTTPPAASGADADADRVHPLSRQILSGLPQPLVLLDRAGRLVWANRAFFEAFTVSPDALGRPLSEAWGSPSEPAELAAFLDDLLSGKGPRDVLIEHPFGRAADRPMRFTGRFIAGEGEAPTLAMVMMQDV